MKELSSSLPAPLAETMQTSVDNFTFELIPSVFFQDGQTISSYPFVEVLWFPRGQEIQNQTAQLITSSLRTRYPTQDIVVVFTEIPKNQYYENGTHF